MNHYSVTLTILGVSGLLAACGGGEAPSAVTVQAAAATQAASINDIASQALDTSVTCDSVGWIDRAGDRAYVYSCVERVEGQDVGSTMSWCVADLGNGIADVTATVRDYELAGAEPLPCG